MLPDTWPTALCEQRPIKECLDGFKGWFNAPTRHFGELRRTLAAGARSAKPHAEFETAIRS